jgi:hypothetical protein
MKSKTKWVFMGNILLLAIILIQLNRNERLILFPEKGSFSELTFDKLKGVEYYGVNVDRIVVDNSNNMKITDANSNEDDAIRDVKDVFKDIKLKQISRDKYSEVIDGRDIYMIYFSGRSEKVVDERTKYILNNWINVRFDKDGKYLYTSLTNHDDFKEEGYYKVVEGDIDFEALDAFIKENKREE